MSAVFIAAAFAAAYIYLIKSTDSSYKIHRMDGYRLYFYVGSYAAGFACISALTLLLLDVGNIPSSNFPEMFDKKGSFFQVRGLKHEDIKVACISVLTFVWAILLLIANNAYYKFWPNAKLRLSYRLTKGNSFEALLWECSVKLSTVSVNLDSGKVYVGLVTEFDLESGEIEYLSILPILSGYRTGKRKKLKFTNNYYQHYEEIENLVVDAREAEKLINEFRVVVPFSEVISISRFDVDAYKAISNQASIIPAP